jgi:hypothetical protein
LFVSFETPDDAIGCAVAIQRSSTSIGVSFVAS